MTVSKYGNILTVVLVILIIVIVVGVGLLIYNYVINPKVDQDIRIEAIEEFDRVVEENKKSEEPPEDIDTNNIQPIEKPKIKPKGKKKVYLRGTNLVMIGYITIPKTNVKEPILDIVTPESLNKAVAVIYPSNPKLNEPGNVVIIGHNYRNGKFFSDNKKLEIGDKIKIKDTTGKELVYTIYQKFETTDQDTSFYNRDTNGAIEITLSTCTDDVKARIIILAKVE